MDLLDHPYLSNYEGSSSEETPSTSVRSSSPSNNTQHTTTTTVVQNPTPLIMNSSCNINSSTHNHFNHHHFRSRTTQNLVLSKDDEDDEASLQYTTSTNNSVMIMAGAVPVTDINTIISSSASNKQPSFDIADFECSLCFRLFCRPVSTPCGHTFCKSCIQSAVKFNPSCPLCRTKLDLSKQKFSVNIVLLNVVEKYFKEEYQQREKEEQEEEEIFTTEKTNEKLDQRDSELGYPSWSYCLIPPVRQTCFVLLSCAD